MVPHIKFMETKSVGGCQVPNSVASPCTFLAETVNVNVNVGSIVDRPLLNTKLMLPNSTIVLSMWFIIRSNIFTVWDIGFILEKLLHSSMIPGVSSLNLHECDMAYVSTASISFSRYTIHCSLVFCHTSIGIRFDHMSYPPSSYPAALWSPLRYRRYFSFSMSRIQQLSVVYVGVLWFSFIQ